MKDEMFKTNKYNAVTNAIMDVSGADGVKPNANVEDDEFFSNSIGSILTGGLIQTAADKDRRERKMVRTKSKAETRTSKADAKKLEATAKIKSAKAIEKTGVATAKALADSKPTDVAPEGMGMGAKIGIGVGILAVLGLGAFFILKEK